MTWAVLIACGLLGLGLLLRAKVKLVQRIFLPASVAGGLVGLVLLQIALHLEQPAIVEPARALGATLASWPGFLIAVVFAGLLLERKNRPAAQAARGVTLAAMMVWIIVLGEVAVGLAVTAIFIAPAYDVPPAFGQLIEAGFAGGHGTAAALGAIFENVLDFPAGEDLGFFVATIGLVYGVASGIVFVNIGLRRGWTRSGKAAVTLVSGLEDRARPQPIAFGRVRADVLDPLALQLVLVAAAFVIGIGLRAVFIEAVDLVAPADAMRFVENVPLFLFTLLGGLVLRRGLEMVGAGELIDDETVKRIVAVAMDFLIVAAITSLRLETLASFLGPITMLLAAGAIWTGVCLLLLSPRVLHPSYWFELGILNYGMSTGTTAQGMMLLRIVDRDLESGAAEDYAMAAPFSAPFVGGGIITLSMPLILERVGTAAVVIVLAIVIGVLFLLARRMRATIAT